MDGKLGEEWAGKRTVSMKIPLDGICERTIATMTRKPYKTQSFYAYIPVMNISELLAEKTNLDISCVKC